jgi:predicted nucleotidyltransferase
MLVVHAKLDIARAYAQELIKDNPQIVAVLVTGSVARGDGVAASDVDLKVLLDVPEDDERLRGDIRTRREGAFIDAEYDAACRYADPDALLQAPYLAGAVREAVILYDRDGTFADVQSVVAAQFTEPRWIRARLEPLVQGVERNARAFAVAVRDHDAVAACRSAAFCLWTASDALLVSAGESPSWVRGLVKLGRVLPEERERIVDIEGSAGWTAEDVSAYVPLFAQSMNPQPGGLMAFVQQEMEWMIGQGQHREAFHALWAGFALGLGGHERADPLARAWLDRIGWRDEMLEEKARQLGECMEHIGRVVESVGTDPKGFTPNR